MQEVYRLIELAAPTPAPGADRGRERHRQGAGGARASTSSRRGAGGRSCRSTARRSRETLLESELFGHEKGAFTGAAERARRLLRAGRRRHALPRRDRRDAAALQAKLLRVLQDGEVRRVGGASRSSRSTSASSPRPTRTAAARWSRPARSARTSTTGSTSSTIALPPLRERREDIPLLVEAFIDEFNAKYDKAVDAAIDEADLAAPRGHRGPATCASSATWWSARWWPADGPVITVKALPNATRRRAAARDGRPRRPDSIVLHLGTTLEDAEREVLLRTLASTSNNKTRAAEILGCTPKTLHNKLQRYAARSGSGV